MPGTHLVEGREYRYVSNKSQVKFGKLFHELFNVPPVIPQNGGALIEECKITLPNGDIFEAISYKGEIEGWRQQLEQGAKALNEEVARIDTDSMVFNDVRFHWVHNSEKGVSKIFVHIPNKISSCQS